MPTLRDLIMHSKFALKVKKQLKHKKGEKQNAHTVVLPLRPSEAGVVLVYVDRSVPDLWMEALLM